MAKLTETLSGVNSGKPIVDPGPAGPSFLGALANFGSGVVESASAGLEMRDRQRQRDEVSARQARLDAAATAQDEFAGALFNTQRTQNRQLAEEALTPEPPAFMETFGRLSVGLSNLSGTEVPPEMRAAADSVLRVRRAVNQGRAGPMAHELALESTIADFYQRYPEQRAEFAAFMQSQNIDHYLFRGIKTEQAAAEAEGAAEIAGRTHLYNEAAKAGLVLDGMDFDQGVAVGRRFIEAQAEGAAVRARIEQEARDRAEGREIDKIEEGRTERDYANNVISQYGIRVDAVIGSIERAIAATGDDAMGQADLSETVTTLRAGLSQARRQALVDAATNNRSADTRKQIEDFFEAQDAALTSLFTGNITQNINSARNLAATLRIDMARSLPMFASIQGLLGPAKTNAVIEGLTSGEATGGISAEAIAIARRELSQWDPTRPQAGMNIARMIEYLQGTSSLKDYTPEEAPGLVQINARALTAVQREVLGGNESEIGSWMTAFGNTVEAAGELQPTTVSGSSLYAATNTYARPESRRVLAMAVRANPELGQALVQASRGTAAHNLLLATRQVPDSMYQVRWTGSAYQVVLDREGYETWARNQSGSGSGYASTQLGGMTIEGSISVPSYEEMLQSGNIPQDMQDRRAAANLALGHLENTDSYDENVSGLSLQERRALWTRGESPSSVARRAMTGPATSQEAAANLRALARQGAEDFVVDMADNPLTPRDEPAPPRTEVQTFARTTFESAGVPWEVTNRLAMKESRWDTEADNGTAQGVFQIKGFNGSWEENVQAGLDHWLEAGRGARAALGREPTPADQYVMYQQGAGGGAALLRPANANRPAWEVLLPLYQREYGSSAERVAKQAVTRNGGTLGMTAAQFAQSIRDYWNR